jgi:TonB family protein
LVSVLRHPLTYFRDEWKAPRTRASLFHYVEDPGEQRDEPFQWKDFLLDLLTSYRSPLVIGSVFADPEELAYERAQLRNRRMEAGVASFLVHLAVVLLLVLAVFHGGPAPAKNDNVVFVGNPIYLPGEGNGTEGGGGGGGGKQEKLPAPGGRMPETLPVQMAAPDPEEPKPLIPSDEDLARVPSVQMPIEIAQDQNLPVGDIMAPPGGPASSGPGSGGGMGSGTGTGIGSGRGPGVGPGSGGGMGGGSGGGIGSGVGPYVVGGGVKPPQALYQPLPAYTEEARKARTEGIVLIQAVIRRDGSVDSFKILRGLGYGLDESAINTIATKWRFRPGTMNGTPVDVQANIEVSFRLY